MLQFSLRHLLVAVAAVAIGAAALVNANDWWASGLWAVSYLSLAYSALASIFRRETKRAFWMGYLVAGSIYVMLLTFLDNGQQPDLITTKILDFGYSALPPTWTAQYWPTPAVSNIPGGRNPNFISHEFFVAGGQALWTLFFCWLGGTVAFWMYSTRDKSSGIEKR